MSDENLTEFAPSEHQGAVLTAFQDEDYGCTVETACQAANVTRQAYYLWFADPEFCRWWMEQAEHFFALRLPRVQSALYRAATEPCGPTDVKYNPRAIELFLQRFDRSFAPRSRQEIAAKVEHEGNEYDTDARKFLDNILRGAQEGPENDSPPAPGSSECPG